MSLALINYPTQKNCKIVTLTWLQPITIRYMQPIIPEKPSDYFSTCNVKTINSNSKKKHGRTRRIEDDVMRNYRPIIPYSKRSFPLVVARTVQLLINLSLYRKNRCRKNEALFLHCYRKQSRASRQESVVQHDF